MTIKSVLIICQGNICRSPMAEGFISHQLSQSKSPITISSAGLGALVNSSAEPKAHAVMQKYGIDISKHRARQLTDELVRRAELILVMTKRQLVALENQFLFAKGKSFLLGHWQSLEIHDPFKQAIDVFERVYHQIEMAWQDWKARGLLC